MNSFSDISQISDIQNISRISRSNSRIIGRIDSLHSLLEQRSGVFHNTSRSTASAQQGVNALEKTARSFASCEETISEFAKNKIILDCIRDASLNESKVLSEDVAEKLKGILLIHELNKYMHLPSVSKDRQEELSVLGITDLPKYELGYEEKLDVKCSVEALLREKIHDSIIKYESSGGNIKEITKAIDCQSHKKIFEPNETQLMNWKDKIEKLCAQYKSDILRSKTLMSNWNNLKYNDMNEIYLKNAKYLLLQAEVAEVQAKITKLSCIIRMFKETPVTIAAFRTLNAVVDDKLFSLRNEIEEKKELKEQYEKLKNTEFDEVLKTYTDLCKAIQKKKQILQRLGG